MKREEKKCLTGRKKMKFNEGKLLLLFTGILSGIVITSLIVGTTATPTKILTYSQYQNQNMELNQLRAEIRGLNKQRDELQAKLRKYDKAGGGKKDIINILKSELSDVQRFYGTSDVIGPGIKIVIDDRNKPGYSNEGEDIRESITHDFDLRDIIAELKNAGAEAIALNGNRVMDNSYITCEGPIIETDNKVVIVPPFEILAIGDPDVLHYSMLQENSHFIDLTGRKLNLKLTPMDNIKIKGRQDIKQTIFMKEKPVK